MCLIYAYRHPSCPLGHVISKAVHVHDLAIYCGDIQVVLEPLENVTSGESAGEGQHQVEIEVNLVAVEEGERCPECVGMERWGGH